MLNIAIPYIANLIKRNEPYNKTPFKGNLIIPAAIQVIEKGIGNKAPTIIKKPPHLLVFFKFFAIFTSK